MKDFLKIESISALEVLDSRGNPTVQVEVVTEGGFCGTSIVPSGASTGAYEAVELRDNNERYNGKGVEKAVYNVNQKIAKEIEGMNVYEQREIDKKMLELDGTENKSKLGANAILGTSMAVARAATNSLGMELYQYLGGINGKIIPMPMMNILNGGKHAENNINIQEFMIIPIGANDIIQSMEMGVKVYQNLKKILKSQGYSVGVGDEGGFAPNLKNEEMALDFIMQAIEKSRLCSWKRCVFGSRCCKYRNV